MGTKFSATAVSGYNASPPSDDGTVSASNQITWAKHKDKLTDPIKTAYDANITALATALDKSAVLVTVSTNTDASHHDKTIQIGSTATSGLTISLGDAATMAVGYVVTINNQSATPQTVGRVTGGDTINGVAANYTLPAGSSAKFCVNSAATGYIILGAFGGTQVPFGDGSAAAPSVKVGDEQNGLFSGATNQLDFAVNGQTCGSLTNSSGTKVFSLSTGTSGADATVEAASTSNSAGADSLLIARVGGATAGDPFTRYAVGTTNSFAAGIDNSDSDSYKISYAASGTAVLGTNDYLTITTGGMALLSDTSNANMTIGLTINQGANDDEILAFKSSSVTHGVTGSAETDTYGRFSKASPTLGGLSMVGISETGSVGAGVSVTGVGFESTTKSTAALGLVMFTGYNNDGTATIATPGANTNIAAFRAGTTTRFILDADGDSHQDVGTAWTTFDSINDLVAMDALALVLNRGDTIRTTFVESLEESREFIEKIPGKPIVTFNEDGSHFANMSRVTMLHHGAIRQLARQFEDAMKVIRTQAQELAELKAGLLPR